jgi:hypothetical protein
VAREVQIEYGEEFYHVIGQRSPSRRISGRGPFTATPDLLFCLLLVRLLFAANTYGT